MEGQLPPRDRWFLSQTPHSVARREGYGPLAESSPSPAPLPDDDHRDSHLRRASSTRPGWADAVSAFLQSTALVNEAFTCLHRHEGGSERSAVGLRCGRQV